MEFLLILLISASCVLVGVVGNTAAPLPPEVYWKHKFPNTPMPAILHDLFHPSDGLIQNLTSNDSPATNRQLQDNPGASLFFLQKDLHPGASMNLQFAISSKSEKAEFISQIMNACDPPGFNSKENYYATSLETLVDYGTSILGKDVNVFSTVIAGDKGQRTLMKKQEYVVNSGARQIVSDNLVVCHSLPYQNAVFFCHATSANSTRAYVVNLVGADGRKIKATAICHKDTSEWDPDHVAFQVLKVKPGTIVPICHFLTEDNTVWASKNEEN